jgi:hypothetical protein
MYTKVGLVEETKGGRKVIMKYITPVQEQDMMKHRKLLNNAGWGKG